MGSEAVTIAGTTKLGVADFSKDEIIIAASETKHTF